MNTFANNLNNRENNFNLGRMLAAILIALVHAYLITLGDVITWGNYTFIYILSKDVLTAFFVLSGFLIVRSMLTSQDAVRYTMSRIMRLVPALLVVSTLVALGMGLWLTSLSLTAYLSKPDWLIYILKTSTALFLDETLPGVLTHAKDTAINIPIWTLRYEILMYAAVVIAWFIGVFSKQTYIKTSILVGVGAYILVTYFTHYRMIAFVDHLNTFSYAFLTGAVFYFCRDKIILSGKLALLLLAIIGSCYFLFGHKTLEILTVPMIGYIFFWFGLAPKRIVKHYRQLGDYSYGFYIIHFPVMQIISNQFGIHEPLNLFFISLPIVFVLSMISWVVIEKPALRMVNPLSNKIDMALVARFGPHLQKLQGNARAVYEGRKALAPVSPAAVEYSELLSLILSGLLC